MLPYGRFIQVLVEKIVVYIKVVTVVKLGPLARMVYPQGLMLEGLAYPFHLLIQIRHMLWWIILIIQKTKLLNFIKRKTADAHGIKHIQVRLKYFLHMVGTSLMFM